jgi:hypothetical protein
MRGERTLCRRFQRKIKGRAIYWAQSAMAARAHMRGASGGGYSAGEHSKISDDAQFRNMTPKIEPTCTCIVLKVAQIKAVRSQLVEVAQALATNFGAHRTE